MKKRSVTVLDEADDFEAKLRWVLFKTEQDKRLFEYNDDVPWYPGMAMYPRPRGHLVFEQTVRYMVQELDDLREWDDWFEYRCEDCETWWVGMDPCWVCGEERLDLTKSFWPGHKAAYTSFDDVTLRLDMSDMERRMGRVALRLREPFEDVGRDAARAGEQMRGLTPIILTRDGVSFGFEHSWGFGPGDAEPSLAGATEVHASNGITLSREVIEFLLEPPGSVPPALARPTITNYDRNGEIVPNRRQDRALEPPVTERRRDYGG
jgi:hypothetical protein